MATLKELRTQKGLTQKDIADELNVRPGTVGAWERGSNMIPPSALEKIAELLQVKPEQIETPHKGQKRYDGLSFFQEELKHTAEDFSAEAMIDLTKAIRGQLIELQHFTTNAASVIGAGLTGYNQNSSASIVAYLIGALADFADSCRTASSEPHPDNIPELKDSIRKIMNFTNLYINSMLQAAKQVNYAEPPEAEDPEHEAYTRQLNDFAVRIDTGGALKLNDPAR